MSKTKIIEGGIQMTSYDIPYWKKYTLSIEEAASYFRIGEGKLRKLVSDNPNAESGRGGRGRARRGSG